MSKKILSQTRRHYDHVLLGYSLPVYHGEGKRKYVDFYAYDPAPDEMRRKKIYVDKHKSSYAQKRHAAIVVKAITEKLLSGWNPWCESQSGRSFTPLTDIIVKYIEYVERTGRKKTIQNYTSKVKILLEFNNQRAVPITYAYQYDKAFIIDFLDWILLDRDAGPRTRNNYKGWCSAFGDFMVQRKYLEKNPAEGIAKLPEQPKLREPLTQQMMRSMERYLRETDPHFMLATLMEYYTFIRPTELSNLRIQDIDIKEQRVFISHEYSKNKRDGFVGINEILIRLMIDLGIFKHPGDWYIFGRKFQPSKEKAGADQFNKRWVKMRKELKWGSEYQFYSLKDTGIRDLANAAGIVIARDQARHTDISTTNKYLGVEKKVHSETKRFRGALDDD